MIDMTFRLAPSVRASHTQQTDLRMTTRNVAKKITWAFRRLSARFIFTACLGTAKVRENLNRARPGKLGFTVADTDFVPAITALTEQATVFKTAVEEGPPAIPLGPRDHLGHRSIYGTR
jgi:hypothetical protein